MGSGEWDARQDFLVSILCIYGAFTPAWFFFEKGKGGEEEGVTPYCIIHYIYKYRGKERENLYRIREKFFFVKVFPFFLIRYSHLVSSLVSYNLASIHYVIIP